MKKLLLGFALIAVTLLSGCSKDDEDAVKKDNATESVVSIASNAIFMNGEKNIVTVNAEPSTDVSSVELFIDGTSYEKKFTSPYKFEVSLEDFATGTHKIVATITFKDGTQKNTTEKDFDFKVRAGDDYQGGLVIKVSEDGFSGTIAAKSDLNNGAKYKYGAYNGNYQAYSLDDGVANTNKFIGKFDANYGAVACLDLDLNGYDDWYLPAHNEMALFEGFRVGLNIPERSGAKYWSSTESSDDVNDAYVYFFDVSYRNPFDKQDMYNVRPCRRFSNN